MGLITLWDLTVKEGIALSPASLLDIIRSRSERLRAAELVKGFIGQVYVARPGGLDSFYRLNLTTKGLSSKKSGACQLLRISTWPSYISCVVEQRGLSNTDLLDSKKILLECHLADKDYSVVYILPYDCSALFPVGELVQHVYVGDDIEQEFDMTAYCKYLKVGKCHHCRASPAPGSKLQACSRCKKGCYCNRDCQAADWPEHKTVCKMLKGLREAAAKAAALSADLAAAKPCSRQPAASSSRSRAPPPRCSSRGVC